MNRPFLVRAGRAFTVVGLTVVLRSTVVAQVPPPPSPSAPRAFAVQQLLWTLYPELQGSNVAIGIRTTSAGVTVTVAPPETDVQRRANASSEPVLVVDATFDGANRLATLACRGPRTREVEMRILLRARADADMPALLRRLGARFSPDDATAAGRLGVDTLERHVGALTVNDVTFTDRTAAAPLRWRVHATTAAGIRYELLYEPFDGRLVGMARLGGGQ